MSLPAAEYAPAARHRRGPVPVVQVVSSLDTGGQEMLCARLVERLDPARFRSRVVSVRGGGWLARRLRDRGVPVHFLRAQEGFRVDAVLRLAAWLRREGTPVVHCHNRQALLYGGLAALLAPGSRLVFTKHGVSFWSDRATALVGRLLLRRARAVAAVSEDIAGPLREGGWVRAERLHAVPNGVDTEEFRPCAGPATRAALREGLGLPAGAPVVGTVARLSPEKDQSLLLSAFARVRARLPEARLLIVGDGPLRGELEARAARLRLGESALFLGERQDVARLLPAMDVFCLPSRTEGMSLTLLEALACGVPAVATAVGGTPEVVRDGETGLLVPSGDPERLAAALLCLLGDPVMTRALGLRARAAAVEHYSLDSMVARYAAIYTESSGGERG